MTEQKCSCCGGELPEEGSPAWNHTTRRDGHCPGHLAPDRAGRVVGCGAFDWSCRSTVQQPRDKYGRYA